MRILHGHSFALVADFLYTCFCLIGFLSSNAPIPTIEIMYKHIKLEVTAQACIELVHWSLFALQYCFVHKSFLSFHNHQYYGKVPKSVVVQRSPIFITKHNNIEVLLMLIN